MAERSPPHRGPDRAGSNAGLRSPRAPIPRVTPDEGSDGEVDTPGSAVTPGHEEEEEGEGHQWRVGDACSVVWGGDGLPYPAHLRALDPASGTCLVEFDGYGTIEKRALAHVLPPCPAVPDTPQGGGPRRPSTPSSREPPPGARRRKDKRAPRSPWPPEAMPPPWPPTLLRAMQEEEEENAALTTMLMSWYLSGYHTGFYMGLQKCRAEAADPPPRPRRREKQPPHS